LSRPSPPPPPPRNPLKQSPPRRQQIQWISKLWPLSKTAEQKCSTCSAVHPSNWPFAKQAPNASHPGRLASRHMVSSRFVWRGLDIDTAWSQACLHCQQAKIHCYTRPQPLPIPVPQRRFSHLHIDLVGPLQYSGGCNYICTVIHCTSNAWQSATPQPTAGQALRQSRRHQAGLVCRPSGFSAFSSSGATKRRSRNRFSNRGPVFCTPWTGGAIPVSTAAVSAPSAA
jgi:hypothetical protein